MTPSEVALFQMARDIAMKKGLSPVQMPSVTAAGPSFQAFEKPLCPVDHRDDCMVSLLASGSKGNAAYIRIGTTQILIDAGISCRRIEQGLNRFHCSLGDIDALFITHEHTDHVRGVPILLKRTHMPVYTTLETWKAMGNTAVAYANRFCRLPRKLHLGDMEIAPFATSHDAVRSVGYAVTGRDIKVTLATDLGYVSDDVREACAWSDYLILEANHDEDMLRYGSYPYALKQRILSRFGHLSNEASAQFLTEIPHHQPMKVLLAHRSEHNNSPACTIQTMRRVLTGKGISIGRDILLRLSSAHGTVYFQ